MTGKYRNICLLLLFLSGVPFVYSLDFDEIVDFSINLRELNQFIENENQLDKDKYYVLNGIFSNISPKVLTRNYFFYITKKDLLAPSSFVNTVKSGSTPLRAFLKESLSADTLGLLNSSSGITEELIDAVLKDISDLIKSGIIYSKDIFSGVSISDELMEIVYAEPAAQEEIVFLNRLLLETAFPDQIKPVQVEMEIVYGEWVGTEEVIGYKCFVNLSGAIAFRVFNRLRPEEGCSLMIPVNTKVLIVAKPLRVITKNGEKSWLLETYYIRKI